MIIRLNGVKNDEIVTIHSIGFAELSRAFFVQRKHWPQPECCNCNRNRNRNCICNSGLKVVLIDANRLIENRLCLVLHVGYHRLISFDWWKSAYDPHRTLNESKLVNWEKYVVLTIVPVCVFAMCSFWSLMFCTLTSCWPFSNQFARPSIRLIVGCGKYTMIITLIS